MREYQSDKLRNIVVLGHGHVGKTSLLESLLFSAGQITRMGATTSGTTVSDFDPEEVARQISIHSTVIPIEQNDFKFNFIDTPGYPDFIGETISAMRAADAALFVFDAVDGYGAGSERLWKYADKFNLPRIVFINKMDKERADFDAIVKKLQDKFGKKLLPMYQTIGEQGPYRDSFIEAAAETDDALLEKYLDGQQLSPEEILTALKKGIKERKIVPILAGSSIKSTGIPLLFSAVSSLLPPPDAKAGEPFSAYVFKTIIEPHVGELSYIRVFSGSLIHSSAVFNSSKGAGERIGQIVITCGKTRTEVPKINTGDIVALPKLKNTRTGDTLCDEHHQIVFPVQEYPESSVSLGVKPKSKADHEKVSLGLSAFTREDPTFKMRYDAETREVVVSGMGDLHLEIILKKLKERYNIDIETTLPRIPYKETVHAKAKAQGKYKKQTGGHGQYGDAWIEIEPLPRGAGFEFVNKIVGGAIPRNYIPAVEKGVKEAMGTGVIAGYPVVDLRVILYDGSYHEVDSSDLAFKIAASMGFKKAFSDARPVMLEPIVHIEVEVPSAHVGNVVSDLNKRRGRIISIEEEKVLAEVPQAEIAKYATELRSFTHGAGAFTTSFSHYEEVLPHIQDNLCGKYQKERELGLVAVH